MKAIKRPMEPETHIFSGCVQPNSHTRTPTQSPNRPSCWGAFVRGCLNKCAYLAFSFKCTATLELCSQCCSPPSTLLLPLTQSLTISGKCSKGATHTWNIPAGWGCMSGPVHEFVLSGPPFMWVLWISSHPLSPCPQSPTKLNRLSLSLCLSQSSDFPFLCLT